MGDSGSTVTPNAIAPHVRIAVDSETFLFQDGCIVPKLVCVSTATRDTTALYLAQEGLDVFEKMLHDTSIVQVGANFPYDVAVFCAERPRLLVPVFNAYGDGRLQCIQTKQKLIDIANGELDFREDAAGVARKTQHSLAALALHWLKKNVSKGNDTWRKRYAFLADVPIENWPADAVSYAIGDARVTWDVDAAQLAWEAVECESTDGRKDGVIPNVLEQNRAHWVLYLMAVWGIRTDPIATAKLRATLEEEQANVAPHLIAAGILRADGTKDQARIRELVEQAEKRLRPEDWKSFFPRTPGGATKTSVDVLKELNEPLLTMYASAQHGQKLLGTYVKALERGTTVPITSRPNVLVDTGRTSWSSPNLQQPPRKGGVRECFVPRGATDLFAFADYDTLELRALAQVCLTLFGKSAMADAIQQGKDLHALLGAKILSVSYEDMLERLEAEDPVALKTRQVSKSFNFGKPGGMGAQKMVAYLKAQNTILDPDPEKAVEVAKKYIEEWHEQWPEMQQFFDHVSELVEQNEGTMIQIGSGRLRGGVGFCDCANGYFQGLAADGAKAALWEVSRECYTVKKSPLYNTRPVLFLHDEIAIEGQEARMPAAAKRLAEIMIEQMARFIPDVPITCKPVLMRRWYKGARPVFVDGKLVPSRPRRVIDGRGEARIVWEADLVK